MLDADTLPEESDEDFDRVMVMADDITETFDDYDASTGEALCVLGVVTGCVLTLDVVSREAALEMLDDLVKQIRQGISLSEQNGSAWWVRNKAN